MTKYVVAVSGGVDSVVLLDMLSRNADNEIIVAHFDHGIRSDSHEDARFVGELARKYGFRFETLREELGADASEEKARERRYAFLHSIADKHDFEGLIILALFLRANVASSDVGDCGGMHRSR